MDPRQQLVAEFRATLEEALILSIADDFDLRVSNGLLQAREILTTLARSAAAEEATGFNPNGLGSQSSDRGGALAQDEGEQVSSDASRSSEAQPSGSSGAPTPWEDDYDDDGDDDDEVPRIASFDTATDAAKLSQLKDMFRGLTQARASNVLKKAKGDFQAALEELLTLQFLESIEDGPVIPGPPPKKTLDDLFKDEDEKTEAGSKRKKGKKGKKRGKQSGMNSSTPSSEEEACNPNQCIKEIAFIMEKLNLAAAGEEVTGAYYRNEGSQAQAILEILDNYIKEEVETQDPATKKHAQRLGQKYKNVPTAYLGVTLHVTPPQFADEILSLLDKHFAKPAKERLAVNYTLAPPAHLVTDGFSTVPTTKRGKGKEPQSAVSSPATIASSSSPSFSDRDAAWTEASNRALRYDEARASASVSAAQAARKGKSNPLYKQAVGVYADIARENGALARQEASRAADLWVQRNRTPDMVDLHGVLVHDGVRIALREVDNWYSSLPGEFRAREARKGFTVVTGLGRHSQTGVSRLRGAVCAGLINGGWKVEVGTGRFTVTGKR